MKKGDDISPRAATGFVPREVDAPYQICGEDLDARFGIGASFQTRRHHDVLDADWQVTSLPLD